MAGRADPYAPERSASELVAEYQRRYQKRRDERRTYNLAAGGVIAVLFMLTAAVVFWGTPPNHRTSTAAAPATALSTRRGVFDASPSAGTRDGGARYAASRTVRATSRWLSPTGGGGDRACPAIQIQRARGQVRGCKDGTRAMGLQRDACNA